MPGTKRRSRGGALADAKTSADAAKIQAQAAIDANRPWIKVTLTPRDITWLSLGPEYPARTAISPIINVANVGHLPALNVISTAWVYLGDGKGESLDAAQKRVCNRMIKDNGGRETSGKLVFPGDNVDASQSGFGYMGASLEGKDLDAIGNPDGDGKKRGSFIIFGCADYVYGSPLEHHQTYFAYIAYHQVKAEKWAGFILKGFAVGEDVPGSEIALTPTNGLNYAN